jgi:hypothetical protein
MHTCIHNFFFYRIYRKILFRNVKNAPGAFDFVGYKLNFLISYILSMENFAIKFPDFQDMPVESSFV